MKTALIGTLDLWLLLAAMTTTVWVPLLYVRGWGMWAIAAGAAVIGLSNFVGYVHGTLSMLK